MNIFQKILRICRNIFLITASCVLLSIIYNMAQMNNHHIEGVWTYAALMVMFFVTPLLVLAVICQLPLLFKPRKKPPLGYDPTRVADNWAGDYPRGDYYPRQ